MPRSQRAGHLSFTAEAHDDQSGAVAAALMLITRDDKVRFVGW